MNRNLPFALETVTCFLLGWLHIYTKLRVQQSQWTVRGEPLRSLPPPLEGRGHLLVKMFLIALAAGFHFDKSAIPNSDVLSPKVTNRKDTLARFLGTSEVGNAYFRYPRSYYVGVIFWWIFYGFFGVISVCIFLVEGRCFSIFIPPKRW